MCDEKAMMGDLMVQCVSMIVSTMRLLVNLTFFYLSGISIHSEACR